MIKNVINVETLFFVLPQYFDLLCDNYPMSASERELYMMCGGWPRILSRGTRDYASGDLSVGEKLQQLHPGNFLQGVGKYSIQAIY